MVCPRVGYFWVEVQNSAVFAQMAPAQQPSVVQEGADAAAYLL